jgi:hypothetical protein
MVELTTQPEQFRPLRRSQDNPLGLHPGSQTRSWACRNCTWTLWRG